MKCTLLLIALAACDDHAIRPLPGASLAPQLRNTLPVAACGTDIAFSETGAVDARYRYLYDAFGRLSFARGSFVGTPYEDTIEYRWDNLDQVAAIIERSSWDGSVAEVQALYSTLGDLVEYTARRAGQLERHTYDDVDPSGHPGVEKIDLGEGKISQASAVYALHYDAVGRLVLATSDDGPTTVYTYDDDARTITIDTDDGAFVGVIEYDGDDHQLAEHWSGSDPMAEETERIFTWTGDRLDRTTYRAGDDVQIETYLYDCDR